LLICNVAFVICGNLKQLKTMQKNKERKKQVQKKKKKKKKKKKEQNKKMQIKGGGIEYLSASHDINEPREGGKRKEKRAKNRKKTNTFLH
jgi:hypothetical protein